MDNDLCRRGKKDLNNIEGLQNPRSLNVLQFVGLQLQSQPYRYCSKVMRDATKELDSTIHIHRFWGTVAAVDGGYNEDPISANDKLRKRKPESKN